MSALTGGAPPTAVRAVEPLARPPDAVVQLPGSKSITNRAVLLAGLATGRSRLRGVLDADDTQAMVGCVRALGASVVAAAADTLDVDGVGGRVPAGAVSLDARQSGTTARFVLAAAAAGAGAITVDGDAQLQARPMGPLVRALRALGAEVDEAGDPERLPLVVRGPARGGPVALAGDISSQFLSGLLIAGPLLEDGLDVTLTTPLVSRPYAVMTAAVMAAFGGRAEVGGDRCRVPSGGAGYRSVASYAVEPDASAASYFLAAAAMTGGRVRVPGLGRDSVQGDVQFAGILESMGAEVRWERDAVTVTGTGRLTGVDVDLAALSDTAPTLAVVAAVAEGPTTVRGIGFVRGKESDRIAAVVTELTRCGVPAEERPDGFVVHPAPRSGPAGPVRIRTYDDHRMAMAFAVLGLVRPGIEIENPGCVAKTFPGFWASLEGLR